MAKYDPLKRYLSRQKISRVEMSFAEIERVIGAFLPKRAQSPDWWVSAEAPATVQAAAWRSAGFRARLTGSERVLFERGVREAIG